MMYHFFHKWYVMSGLASKSGVGQTLVPFDPHTSAQRARQGRQKETRPFPPPKAIATRQAVSPKGDYVWHQAVKG